jgi:hypothetical protein
MSLLLSGPPEIVTHILQGCDVFHQLLSIAGTCKHLYSVWANNSGVIAWEVGKRSIVSFDDALMEWLKMALYSDLLGHTYSAIENEVLASLTLMNDREFMIMHSRDFRIFGTVFWVKTLLRIIKWIYSVLCASLA